MPTSREVIAFGVDLAARLIGPPALAIQAPLTFVAALESMGAAERALEEARQKLIAMDAAGVAVPLDYVAYDKVRHNVYAGTTRLVRRLTAWLEQHHPSVVSQIPRPQLAPPVTPGTGRELQRRAQQSNLGALPAIAAGAAAWPVVAIILAVLAALGLLAVIAVAIAVTAEMIRDAIVAEAQTRALVESQRARERIFTECRDNGGQLTECADTASQLAPTPREAFPAVPPPEGSGWAWIAWAAGAVAVVALTGGAVYVYANERGGRRSAASFNGLRPKLERITARPTRRARRVYDLDVER